MSESKRKVILSGTSWGGKPGDERMVGESRAAELVAAGLAKYAPNSKAAKSAS